MVEIAQPKPMMNLDTVAAFYFLYEGFRFNYSNRFVYDTLHRKKPLSAWVCATIVSTSKDVFFVGCFYFLYKKFYDPPWIYIILFIAFELVFLNDVMFSPSLLLFSF